MELSRSWLSRCSTQFLSHLPERLKVCVLLSNDNQYIEACFKVVSLLHPKTRRINSVAYGDGKTTWVHIIHVGGPGKNHISSWFDGEGKQGQKRRDATIAVSEALRLPRVVAVIDVATARFGSNEKNKRAEMEINEPVKIGKKGNGRPVPRNDTRDGILSRIKEIARLKTFPGDTHEDGTKYISGFITENGIAFAIDKMSASKQPIWILDTPGISRKLATLRIKFEVYPPERGRNSNLHKIPDFKHGRLIRSYPETVDQALQIVEFLEEGEKGALSD